MSLTAVCLFMAVRLLLNVQGVPYNVRELFGRHADTRWIALFAILLTWMSFGPAWVSAYLAAKPRRIFSLPLWAVGVSGVSWAMLRYCVTPESLHDILGTPVLGRGEEPELILRFLALNGAVVLIQIVTGTSVHAVRQSGWRPAWKLGIKALLLAIPWLVLARVVVINWAATDNLVELIRSAPVPGEIAIGLLVMLLASNGAFLGCQYPPPWRVWLAVACIVSIILIIPAWYLLNLGLAPEVGGSTPAIRFLLGPDRRTALSEFDLFLRWCLLYAGAAILLSMGHWATRRPSCPDPHRQAS